MVNGEETLSLNDLEKKYTKTYPFWDKSCQSFPEGPILYGKGKLLNGNLFTKATDIEEKQQNLKSDIISISSIPFDIKVCFYWKLSVQKMHYDIKEQQF